MGRTLLHGFLLALIESNVVIDDALSAFGNAFLLVCHLVATAYANPMRKGVVQS